MPASPDIHALERALATLQRAHPELETLNALVLVALDQMGEAGALSTARLARRLEIEHALIRRACAELEALGWVAMTSAGSASPALAVRLIQPLTHEERG